MIEIDPMQNGTLVVRFRGSVTNGELACLAATISNFDLNCGLLVFLDWLGIDRWVFEAPNANSVKEWRKAAKRILRVAIVHDHRVKRQSAWLAAMLRKEGVGVRSWRPQYAAMAAAWLR
jgi:hypothetical protein